jgi:hypothetical protein
MLFANSPRLENDHFSEMRQPSPCQQTIASQLLANGGKIEPYTIIIIFMVESLSKSPKKLFFGRFAFYSTLFGPPPKLCIRQLCSALATNPLLGNVGR